MVFVIHWHESAMDIHVFSIPIPPSLPSPPYPSGSSQCDSLPLSHQENNLWSGIQFSSAAQSCLTLCDSTYCSMPGFPVLHHLLELSQTHLHWIGDANQPSCPLLSTSPAFNFSQHQDLFQWVALCIRWPKYQSFSFSISSSSEYSGLISFRNGWFDLLAVQRTLKSLSQYHS